MTVAKSFMVYEAATAMLKSLDRNDLNLVNYSDDRIYPVLACCPKDELLGNLNSMLSDERDIGVTVDSRRAPHMRGFSFNELRDSYRRLLAQFPSKVAVWETKFMEEWGPPLDTSYAEYNSSRFMPHYDTTQRSVSHAYVEELFDELGYDIRRSMGDLRLMDPTIAWDRRNISSNLGPNFMRSLRDCEAVERHEILYNVTKRCREYRRSPRDIVTLAKPGTRISHAPIGAEPEDYNRIILMIDVLSYFLAATYTYPFMDAMRQFEPFRCVYGSNPIRDFVQSHPDFIYISCDTSRMDHHVKWDPYGMLFAKLISSLYPHEDTDFITAVVDSIHHPLVMAPVSALYGPIGNASGSTDTTIKNCCMSDILLRHVCKKYKIPYRYTYRSEVGDDAFLAIDQRFRGNLPDDVGFAIQESWADLGFRAKHEKQLFGRDALFLKKYFSCDPQVGKATMMGANVIKKMIHERPVKVRDLFGTFDMGEEEMETAFTVDKVQDYTRHYQRYRQLNPGVPPASTATWPYFVADERILSEYSLWFGPKGPILSRDVWMAKDILEKGKNLTPDRLRALSIVQSLSQLRYHPNFDDLVQWVATHLDASSVLLDLEFYQSLAEDLVYNVSTNLDAIQTPLMLLRVMTCVYIYRYSDRFDKRLASRLLSSQYVTLMSRMTRPSEYSDSVNIILARYNLEVLANDMSDTKVRSFKAKLNDRRSMSIDLMSLYQTS